MRTLVFLKRPGRWTAVFALVAAFFSLSVSAQQTLSGHVPPAIGRLHLQPLGNVPAGQHLNLAIDLPLQNEAGLDKLIQQIYDPASPNYHHYLTPDQFTVQFGPTEQDYDKVVAFLKANGLTVTGTSPNRMLVDAAGDTATVDKLFHVALHTYRHPTENRTFFAPDTEPVIDLDVPISHISGLDNFVIPRPAVHVRGVSGTHTAGVLPASGSGPGGEYMGKDFRAAYAPGVTLDGTGQTVGLLELEGYLTNDITTYEANAGFSQVTITNILVDSFPGVDSTDTNGITEVSLDMEMAISMATNMNRLAVFEMENGGNDDDILNAIALNGFVKQVSSSWLIEDSSSYDTYYKEMAAQGQSFFQASGDDDAFYSGIGEWADDTNITLVGGTTLSTTGPGGSYASETVWQWGYDSAARQDVGSGGGINFNGIAIPGWQQGINMTNNQGSTTLRNVPDVALPADNISVQAVGQNFPVGGTSAAAPLWAGFTALVNQQAAGYGLSTVGFINPAIYAIGKSANYTNCFHDIVVGNNTNSALPNKYYAEPGYDLCTGWGSPNGQTFITTLIFQGILAINPINGFTAAGLAGGPFSPSSQNYTLTNSSAIPLAWSLINTSSWLNVSVTAGTLSPNGNTNLTISLGAIVNSLAIGTYNASVLLSNGLSHTTEPLSFTLQVTEPLSVSPSALSAAGAAGGLFAPTSQNFTLTNVSPTSLNWQAAGPSWLTISPSSGTLAGNKSAVVNASLNAGANNLTAGVYSGSVAFTDELSGMVEDGGFTLSIGQTITLNGGFELGNFTDWTLNEGNKPVSGVDYQGESSGIPPHSGNYLAALGNPSSLGTLSQTLATVSNQSYLLSVWLNSPNVSTISQASPLTANTPNQFTVSWNGTTLFNQSNIGPIGWTNLLFIVTATSSSTVLKFGERVDPWFFGLDDVNVWPIPSPNIHGVSQISNTAVGLTVNSLPSLIYEVQYSTNLLSTNWFNLNTNTASGTTLTITNPIGANPFLYYRVLRLP